MATRKGLNSKDYFLRERNTNNSYLNLHGLDDVVGSGYHSFYIIGSRYLERGSEIEFEIVDSAGNAVSINAIKSVRKGNARVVSFTITDDIEDGGATLYVSATLNQYLDESDSPVSIPSEWNGKPNFLFSYNFTINKSKPNSDDIIFRKEPRLDVTPTRREVKKVNKKSVTIPTGSGGSALTGSIENKKQISQTEYIVDFNSTVSVFDSVMVGGDVRLKKRKYEDSNGNQKTFSYINYERYPTDDGYVGEIVDVVDEKTAKVRFTNPDISVFGSGNDISYEGTFIPDSQDIIYEIDFTTIPYDEETLIQQGTYADIHIRDLQTVSGDVEKVRVYKKSDSEGTNYSLAFEGNVDEQDSLLKVSSNFDIGLFDSGSKLTEWTASDATNPGDLPTDGTPEFLKSDELFLNGAVISGSNDVFTKTVDGNELQEPLYSLESNTSFKLYKDIEYGISLNAGVENVIANDTRLDVYVSGSGLPDGVGNRFGDLVYSFRTDDDKKWNSDELDIRYNGDYTLSDARIIFVVTSGKWHLSDIVLKPHIAEGFSVDEYRTQIPLNVLRPHQDFDFKVEFFDGKGNKSNKVLRKENVTFERSNLVIEGEHNVLTGSMYAGGNSGSGVRHFGSVGGGSISSTGYRGFNSASKGLGPAGFLLYSGSVLSGSSNNYKGVGLELVIDSSSYFRYRTNPSELTVRTDRFFFGSDQQFISGSDGNIEISSSLFHLDPSNNTLTLSGSITATAGTIGGFDITSDALVGNNFYLSGSSTGNQYFISSSKWNVKANGDMTGSSALLEGGKIAGFTFNGQYISGSNLEINSDGTIQTSNFADGVRGWQLSSVGNGSAQFENVKIRGTLSTTTFEKKTVNAVGGQLWISNSTIISESISSTETTMSVENVTGFEQNEVLLIKKVTGSGINTEYVLVESSSRFDNNSSTNLRGELYVQRAYGSGSATGSDVTWVSELAGSATDYTEGQSIVSTGRTDTGWILANASPDNTYTPYIDIVERTGSGVYDYGLKVRLGDLSGLTSTQLLGDNPSNAGHGLFSENVYLTGTINATAGNIGGFTITQHAITGSNFYISGSATGNEIFINSNDTFVVRADGEMTASAGEIGGFNISSTQINDTNNDLILKSSGQLTASDAKIEGNVSASSGYLGNWKIQNDAIVGKNIVLDATGSLIYKADQGPGSDGTASFPETADEYYIDFTPQGTGSNPFYVKFGPNFNISSSGELFASGAQFEGTVTASAGLIGGFTIETSSLRSNNNNFWLSGSATGNETFINANDNFFVKANGDVTGSSVLFDGGTIGGFDLLSDEIKSSNNNLRLKADGEITGSDVLFDGGKIGGWKVSSTYISSSNLIINSDGTLETADFADGVRGWQITSVGNGSAQFENAKIRGTLKTTVFEKESVNAVGGQLWVANSTTLSESVSDTQNTMSVQNVTGFAKDEVALIKKVTGTGFKSEYVLIESASRDGSGSQNFNGKLYVQRAYGEGISTGSNVTWVSELAGSSGSYTEGQTVVSTGRTGSGWILANATPTDTEYTPYLDIVERTGSGVYDYELKARLGDLSGLSQTRLLGVNPQDAGFGLYSENVFLEGGIRASFGEIGGWSIYDTQLTGSNLILSSSGQIVNTTQISSSNAYQLNDNGSGHFAGKNIEWDSNGNVTVDGVINVLGGNAATDSDVTNLSQSAETVRTNLSGSISDRIVTDANNKIVKANATPTGQGSGLFLAQSHLGYYSGSAWSAYISSSGEFLFEQNSDNKLSFGNGSFVLRTTDTAYMSGSDINIITPSFFFGKSGEQYISGSNGNLEIQSNNFTISQNGDATFSGQLSAATGDFSGTITSSAGKIGGWEINTNTLSAGNGSITLDSSTPKITVGSVFDANGSTNIVDLAGWTASGSVLKAYDANNAGFDFDSSTQQISMYRDNKEETLQINPNASVPTSVTASDSFGSVTNASLSLSSTSSTGSDSGTASTSQIDIATNGDDSYPLFISFDFNMTVTGPNTSGTPYSNDYTVSIQGYNGSSWEDIDIAFSGNETNDVSDSYPTTSLNIIGYSDVRVLIDATVSNLDVSYTVSNVVVDQYQPIITLNSKGLFITTSPNKISSLGSTEGSTVISTTDWGDIGGTLSDQTDLQDALDGKADNFSNRSVLTGITSTDTNNWNTAYNNHITSVSGNGDGTLTLTQNDGGTITANLDHTHGFADLPISSTDESNWNTAYNNHITSVSGNGDGTLTLTQNDGGTITANLDHGHSASEVDAVSKTNGGNFGGSIQVTGSIKSTGNNTVSLSSNPSYNLVDTDGDNWKIQIASDGTTFDIYNTTSGASNSKLSITRQGNVTVNGTITTNGTKIFNAGKEQTLSTNSNVIFNRVEIGNVLFSNQENNDADIGMETVATASTNNYDGVFFDYTVKSGSNVRAGTVYSVHDGTDVEFTEISTNDLGDTSDVTLLTDISASNMRLRAEISGSNNWNIKSLVRGI